MLMDRVFFEQDFDLGTMLIKSQWTDSCDRWTYDYTFKHPDDTVLLMASEKLIHFNTWSQSTTIH